MVSWGAVSALTRAIPARIVAQAIDDGAADRTGSISGEESMPVTAQHPMSRVDTAWLRMGWEAFARSASEDKAYLHVTSSAARAAAAAWLAERPEVPI